ncbi:MAG: hypothetical protein M1834_005065 [Cirrosporium novae-zelandiae]|nr:MAG: hypothetical protein M1834_005065 [Cirrosporium novae-zelandiae]
MASPLLSYSDQIWSMHNSKSSAGFSLDIPLIMLVASVLKVYYWFGEHFDLSLLVQACIMVVVQIVLLKVALDNRPVASVKDGIEHIPFHDSKEGELRIVRPYNFWQWRSSRPYWQFLAYFTLTLSLLQLFVGSVPLYIALLGYAGLAIEAILPIPQILSNQNAHSCKGFRASVLANWLAGDMMKMSFFFFSQGLIPWPFKLCGMFQFGCDICLGVQYYVFGDGSSARSSVDRWAMAEKGDRLT